MKKTTTLNQLAKRGKALIQIETDDGIKIVTESIYRSRYADAKIIGGQMLKETKPRKKRPRKPKVKR